MDSLKKLNNDNLITAYISAIKYKLSNDFVLLLKKELIKRNISIH
ncbi:sporulation histidine kinase inhibitor Sda [Cytobacillus oceanisediminis]|uniref:Sporulation histidine kinase inhibitor Sda n=2 Tax=Niallia TaxID=2837506 RepID=A0A941GE05_NIACI|nr:sporulation histidine kinase inhibitor Sda [Niallia circulans]EOR21587.1 hypothetical protein A499_22517 [Niallia nealsonii AAU1]MBQ6449269.1 sporulation histidine kinase inhibitor Sda [Bacillus sp. (in: firmicutes)]MBZ9535848.1 sporulation histidine kinase inhibitor Sda [Cytobacillus oceanisediminis]NMO77659.1 sporulation histidine kinase inhibitor Sda [Niallia alba]MCB5238511.1 sporulation histidine kinase inhibitor Sda [Niallia circulans]